MSSCRTIRTDSRIRSTPSPARNASSSSDTADWDNAIGGLLFSVCLAVHTEDPADGPMLQQGTPSITPNPTTPGDSHQRGGTDSAKLGKPYDIGLTQTGAERRVEVK